MTSEATGPTPMQNDKLVEALERCAQIVDRNIGRQDEKIADVPIIARRAIDEHRRALSSRSDDGVAVWSNLLTKAVGDISAALILAGKQDKIQAWTAPYAESLNQFDAHPPAAVAGEGVKPLDMLLWCPKCNAQHIDEPSEGWDNPPHRSHLCHDCGCIWRPADFATNGVANIKTAGDADTWGWVGGDSLLPSLGKRLEAALSQPAADAVGTGEAFQQRVQPWLMTCFGEMIAGDREERNHRFLEEALELVQSCGCTASEAHQLVDYVYGRPVGEPAQEVGGVMVTLAALCLANGLDMHSDGETELARIWTKVEAIRAKQAAKPKHSPLPAHPLAAVAGEGVDPELVERVRYAVDHPDAKGFQLAKASMTRHDFRRILASLSAALKRKEPQG